MMRLTLALSLLVASAPLALAQRGTPQEQKACSRDASRLCRQYLSNDNEVQACLQQNRAKLSTSCKKVFESHGM
jgi:hypothetical protein